MRHSVSIARLLILLALLVLARAGEAWAGDSVTFEDDVGRQITLPVPVKRTVVFNRYTTEFIRAIAGMGVVVGDDIDPTKEPDYWPTVTNTGGAQPGSAFGSFGAVSSGTLATSAG